jgi:hypothetical protein
MACHFCKVEGNSNLRSNFSKAAHSTRNWHIIQNIERIKIDNFHLKDFSMWWKFNKIQGKIISDTLQCDITCNITLMASTNIKVNGVRRIAENAFGKQV